MQQVCLEQMRSRWLLHNCLGFISIVGVVCTAYLAADYILLGPGSTGFLRAKWRGLDIFPSSDSIRSFLMKIS